jgi:hypothetical protein
MIAFLAPFLLLVPAAPKAQGDPVRDELTRLFDQVHKDLREIDRLLLEAGGDRGAASKGSAAVEGMKRLLEQAEGRERSAVRSIEEILRKAPT